MPLGAGSWHGHQADCRLLWGGGGPEDAALGGQPRLPREEGTETGRKLVVFTNRAASKCLETASAPTPITDALNPRSPLFAVGTITKLDKDEHGILVLD